MTLVPVLRCGELTDFALVDEQDVEWVRGYRWIWFCGYALSGARLDKSFPALGSVQLHRLVLGLTRGDGKVVHHINEDKLDNRRENLMVCDSPQEANLLPHPRRDHTVGNYERFTPFEEWPRTKLIREQVTS